MTIRPEYAAHTPNEAGEWHDLLDHLESTAKLASEFAASFDAAELGWVAGLLHDVGKLHPGFQRYLDASHAGKPVARVPHAIYGSILSESVALPVAGHHAGLSTRSHWLSREHDVLQEPTTRRVIEAAMRLLGRDRSLEDPPFPGHANTDRKQEVLQRMVFSALIDADRLDTERHFRNDQWKARRSDGMPIHKIEASLRDQMRQRIANTERSSVNSVRREVYEACMEAARCKPGIFRLTVPTGGGKTLSSLSFALSHAAQHGMKRVIVAIPYTSIIDQTADVYRSDLGSAVVLEHHSAFDDIDDVKATVRQRLAAENWDMPLIVTTTVQLFESLFSNRPSKCRKLHRIARSVIVIDEVQTLPIELLEPTLDMLRTLVEGYGVSVVLCTATQPSLEGSSNYLHGLPSGMVQEIVPQYPSHFEKLKRVRYEYEPMALQWTDVAVRMRSAHQILTIVNTKRDAVALLEHLRGVGHVYHLSTRLCPSHRRQVIRDIRHRLDSELPCRVVSTQVIEAGVDVDFPIVMRALGPLDRIAQAGGRCNREGRRQLGTVVVFDAAESPDDLLPAGAYRSGTMIARSLLKQGVDVHDPAVFRRYFESLYQTIRTDERKIQALREQWDFPGVAAKYKMIDADSHPVVVPYGDWRKVLDKLDVDNPDRHALRGLQPFIVGLTDREFRRMDKRVHRDGILAGLHLLCHEEDYHLLYGVRV